MAALHHILEQKAVRILHPVPEAIVGVIAKKAKNGSACEDILTYYYSDCDTEFCRMV